MRKRDLVAKAIILLGLDHLPLLGGIGSEAARIELAHRNIGSAMHHPARQFAGQAGPPANADLGTAAAPVIFRVRHRTDQRIAVGRVGDRTMYFAFDAQFGEYGHALHRIFEPWHDPVVISFKQFVLGFPRASIEPDSVGVGFFVDTDQARLLLHPDVAGNVFVVADHRQFPVEIAELRRRMIRAPNCRAPVASAWVMPEGSAWPSSGVCSAPMTPSRL